jgi:hypothetical protein
MFIAILLVVLAACFVVAIIGMIAIALGARHADDEMDGRR